MKRGAVRGALPGQGGPETCGLLYLSGPKVGSERDYYSAASWLRGLGFEVRSAHEIPTAAAQADALVTSGLLVLVGAWQDDPDVAADLAVAETLGIPAVSFEHDLSPLIRREDLALR